MKKTVALLLAMVMLVGIISACGKKEDSGNVSPGTTSSPNPGTTSNPNPGTTGNPSPGTTSNPSPGTTGNPSPGTTDKPAEKVNPSDKTLNIAFSSQPNSWQQLTMPIGSVNVALQIDVLYDTLINYDSDTGGLLPNLATSWEWINDLTLRLKLLEGVTSINGDPFTADDVVYTIKAGCEEITLASYYSAILDPDNTKAVDKYTVDIAVKEKYPFLPLDLTHNAYQMSVEASVNAAGGLAATRTNPISGTGPYKMVEHVDSQYAKFERRNDYWGTLPYYKTVVLYFVPDSNTRGMGLEAGEYDYIQRPSSAICNSLKNDPDYKVLYSKNEAVVIFPMNSNREPFNIKEVRQAIALAIDYNAILQVAIGGAGETVNSPFSPTSQAYHPINPSKPNYLGKYDPAAAKQKLIEAGYPNGFTMSITYRSNDSIWVNSAEIIQNNLKAIGITVNLNPVDNAVFYTDSETGNHDSLIWTQQNPNPRRMIQILDDRYIQCNVEAGWITQDIMDLFDRGLTELNDDARYKIFGEITDILREQVPLVPLVQANTAHLMNSKIIHFKTCSYGVIKVESVWEEGYLG